MKISKRFQLLTVKFLICIFLLLLLSEKYLKIQFLILSKNYNTTLCLNQSYIQTYQIFEIYLL